VSVYALPPPAAGAQAEIVPQTLEAVLVVEIGLGATKDLAPIVDSGQTCSVAGTPQLETPQLRARAEPPTPHQFGSVGSLRSFSPPAR
jgi:hypothetical protein